MDSRRRAVAVRPGARLTPQVLPPLSRGGLPSYSNPIGLSVLVWECVVVKVASPLVLVFLASCGALAQAPKEDPPKAPAEPAVVGTLRGLGALIEKEGDAVVSIDLTVAKISDANLTGISAVKTLQRLDLSGTPVSDAGLATLKGLPQLEALDLRDTPITDAGLVHLSGLTKLRYLNLAGTRVRANLAPLGKLTALQTLDLSRTTLADNALNGLAPLKNLQTLSLYGTPLGDAGLGFLKGLSGLSVLDVGSTKISDAGLVSLKGLGKLSRLVVSGTGISDKGLASLQGAPALKLVDAIGTKITAEGAEAFIKSQPEARVSR